MTAEALPQLSADGAQFWDGQRWGEVDQQRRYFWDGHGWQALPWWAQPDFDVNVPFSGTYLGGHPQHPAREKAVLWVHKGGVTVQRGKTPLVHSTWAAVLDVSIEGPVEFRRRASATRLIGFGLLGYVTASGKFAYLTFDTAEGPIAFEASRGMAHEIKPVLHPVLRNFPETSAPPAEQKADGFDALLKLNELRQAGAITDAEYDAKKAELLARL